LLKSTLAISIAFICLTLTSCGSGPSAQSLAKQACSTAPTQGSGTVSHSSKDTVGDEIKALRIFSETAATAAAIDPRWTSLVASGQVIEQEWRYVAEAVGMKTLAATTGSEAYSTTFFPPGEYEQGQQAMHNIQTQCAIADSGP
jgi:hypothetical protein